MKTIAHRSFCPVSYALDFFGDKWTLLVLRDMMFYNKTSYGEFLTSTEKIATNILADRLNMLYNEGFIIKSVSPANKSKFIYGLTEKGIALVPLMVEFLLWGADYKTFSEGPEVLLSQIQKNKGKFIATAQERLREEREALTEVLAS